MAFHNEENPPALPQRDYLANSMDVEVAHAASKTHLEDSLDKLHDSLARKIAEYHFSVERALGGDTLYNGAGNSQVSSGYETLVESLWSLVEPQQQRTLHDFQKNPVGHVGDRLADLDEQVRRITADKTRLENEMGNSLAVASAELKETKVHNQRLSDRNTQLRSIILKGSSGNTEVPDDKIRNQFVELREIIQRMVHRHYSALGHIKLKSQNNTRFEEQKRFRNTLKELASEPLQRFCMRAKLFELIDNNLLSARSFGLGKFENRLGDFESNLDSSGKVPRADLVEWRSRTIGCGSWLEEKSQWPIETCQDMLDFMDPFSPETNKEPLERLMYELCKKAYDLSLLMRRSRKATFDTFIWKETAVTPAIEADITCQTIIRPAELLNSEIGISKSRIIMTIFGALKKIPEGSSDDQVLLEKSHVVCRV